MTKDFLYPKTFAPKALIIGHDPRLQNSDTIADYALFADYYFEPKEEMNGAQQKNSALLLLHLSKLNI